MHTIQLLRKGTKDWFTVLETDFMDSDSFNWRCHRAKENEAEGECEASDFNARIVYFGNHVNDEGMIVFQN
jgi:hypothetical protein